MPMQSLSLLPTLEMIPVANARQRIEFDDVINEAEHVRSKNFATEIAVGIETALTALVKTRHVPDDLREAYAAAYPRLASDHSLYDQYQEMIERGPSSVHGFECGLKGKLAEIRLIDKLGDEFPDHTFSIASEPNQPIWDIVGTNADGVQDIFVQVKMGGSSYAHEVLQHIDANPEVYFGVSNELLENITASNPSLADHLIDTDLSNFEVSGELTHHLDVLSGNLGFDVPDEIADVVPYVSEIVAGLKLIATIKAVKKDYSAITRDERNRVYILKTLVVISKFGVTSVCGYVGLAGGTAINVGIGSVVGGIAGVTGGYFINRKLTPHLNGLFLEVLDLSEEDLFYFKNKSKLDEIGRSLSKQAVELAEQRRQLL